MKNQWHCHERWGTMGFVPLSIVSLLCSFYTWSCHKAAVPAAVALPQVPGNWHGLGGCCSGAASLSWCSGKSPVWLWSPAPAKWLFISLWLWRKSPPAGSVYTPDVLQGPVSVELSWKMLLDAVWGSSESWNEPVLTETPLWGHSLSAASSASPASLHWSCWVGLGGWACCLSHPLSVLAIYPKGPGWYPDLTFQLCSMTILCRWLSEESGEKAKQKSSPRPAKKPNIFIMPWTSDQISA